MMRIEREEVEEMIEAARQRERLFWLQLMLGMADRIDRHIEAQRSSPGAAALGPTTVSAAIRTTVGTVTSGRSSTG